MREIIFRILGLILGSAILYVHFFLSNPSDQTIYATIRNLLVGGAFLIFAIGGNKLIQKIPLFKSKK